MRFQRSKFLSAIILIIISAWRISSGEWDITFSEVIRFLLTDSDCPASVVIRLVRLPRLLCSIFAGGILSVSGVILQGLLSNPLAEPYTLGIASGSAFGAAIGILGGSFAVMPCAFCGAVGALLLTGAIAGNGGRERLILAGVISNAVLSAGVTFMKSIAGEKIGAVVLWLMGSFAGASWRDVWAVICGAVIILTPAYVMGNALDVMSLGGERASVLGVNEKFVRVVLLVCSSVGVAFCVSSFGVIGFVGLIVPHISRGLVGANHRRVTVNAFMIGAVIMTLADGLAQRLGEIPAGVVTALTGGPFFCYVFAKDTNSSA